MIRPKYLTKLGIGEALVSCLNEKGIPTPLARTMLRAPMSRMDILTQDELNTVISNSKLAKKYNEVIDRESAYEILNEKIERATKLEAEEQNKKEDSKTSRRTSSRRSTRMNPILKVVTSATFIRGVLGVLKKVMK